MTRGRRPYLRDRFATQLLRQVYRECASRHPFVTEAITVMPDHLHAIWTLPRGDTDYSLRWNFIKGTLSRRWRAQRGAASTPWQARFWEHTIRGEDDFVHHVDYIHFNAVKHGFARCVHDWSPSTFHGWVRRGMYPSDWGCQCDGRSDRWNRLTRLSVPGDG